MSRLLITGSSGFIGGYVFQQAQSMGLFKKVFVLNHLAKDEEIKNKIGDCDLVFHIAGVNRSSNKKDFKIGNIEFTKKICQYLGKHKGIVYASSILAGSPTPYGDSKMRAEEIIKEFSLKKEFRGVILRLPNIFGEGCRPNYNSVVATFCYNISHGLPIEISNPDNEVNLLYIRQVFAYFISSALDILGLENGEVVYNKISTSKKITVGDLAKKIKSFKDDSWDNYSVFDLDLLRTYSSY